jgi:hypothetical protein
MEQGSGSRFAAGLERTGPAPHRRARLNLTAALTAAPTASGPPQARMSELGPFPQSMLTYQAWRGIPELGLALKSMLESTFMKVRQPAHAEDPSQGSPGARSPLPRGPPSKRLLPGAASQGPRREEVPSRGVGSNVAGGVAGASGQHGVTASQASLCPQRPTHNPGPQLDPQTPRHPRPPPPGPSPGRRRGPGAPHRDRGRRRHCRPAVPRHCQRGRRCAARAGRRPGSLWGSACAISGWRDGGG